MSAPGNRGWDRETTLLAQIAACVSILAFLYYLRQGQILLYGDAVAHINIARRVFDSRTPGPLQLGTVWLPLPHLVTLPLLVSDWLWKTGIGGSIPSLFAYVIAAVGIFNLVRGSGPASMPARTAAWIAAFIFIANPNLIYLQSTAMTEPLYLAFFIWSLVYFGAFVSGDQKALPRCALCLLGASLTRYDGWFLAAAMIALVLAVAVFRRSVPRKALVLSLAIAAAGPILWLAYNAAVYKNPLEFANGPYSARAIEQRTSAPGSPPHPGAADLPVAASFFLKSAELNVGESNWHRIWPLLALVGCVLLLFVQRKRWPLLLLWLPLPFYTLSVAYSGVPIFLPPWWPFSLYNVRYGIELLPAFAVFCGFLVAVGLDRLRDTKAKLAVVALGLVLVSISYAFVWKAQPISFREAWVNSRTRVALETQLARNLVQLPKDATLLMYTGDHVGALQQAGIPLRRVINEGNHRTWVQPYDPQGLWERALQDPQSYADFVVASEADQVALKIRRDQLSAISVIHVSGQPATTIYRVNRK